MTFTEEARQKAAATRSLNKQKAVDAQAEAQKEEISTLILLQQMQKELREQRERADRLEAKLGEKPREEPRATNDRPLETERSKVAEDDYLVTVLYGYGKVAANYKAYIDATEFVGGVATDVPWSVAKHWVKNTRPDGGKAQGKVIVQVLPQDATAADYARTVGVAPMPIGQLAALLQSTNIDHLAQSLGPARTRELADSLRARAK